MSSITEKVNAMKSQLNSQELPDDTFWDLIGAQAIADYIIPFFFPAAATLAEQIDKTASENTKGTNKLIEAIFGTDLSSEITQEDRSNMTKEEITIDNARIVYETLNTKFPTNIIMAIIKAGAYYLSLVKSELSSLSEKSLQEVNKENRPYLLDLNTLVELFYRTKTNDTFVRETMQKMGIKDTEIEYYLQMQKEILPLDAIKFLYNRNLITKQRADELIKAHKFDASELPNIYEYFKIYPSINDEISFMKRDVYTKEIVDRFGLLQGVPQKFLEQAKKLGMDSNTAALYWGTHWEYPSMQMAREMFQRGFIDRADIDTIMSASDVLPYFRNAYIETLYNVPTRVDVRRMYKIGVIGREDVVKFHMDMGYSKEIADLLTLFVEQEYDPEGRDLSKSNIISFFKNGSFDEQTAITQLQQIGYTYDFATDLLNAEKIKDIEKEAKELLKSLKNLYLNGKIDENGIRSQLASDGFTTNIINRQLKLWNNEKAGVIKNISEQNLEKLIKAGIINDFETERRLKLLGYSDTDASLLIALWSL